MADRLLDQLIECSNNSVPQKPIIDFRVLRPYAETGLEYARNGRRKTARNFLAYLRNVINSPGWMSVANYSSYQDDAREVTRLKKELESELAPKTDANQPEYAAAGTR